jgi:hypothetical protein
MNGNGYCREPQAHFKACFMKMPKSKKAGAKPALQAHKGQAA